MLDPVDHQLLHSVQAALAVPFADPVLLREPDGRPHRAVPRRDARAMERVLLKLRNLGARA